MMSYWVQPMYIVPVSFRNCCCARGLFLGFEGGDAEFEQREISISNSIRRHKRESGSTASKRTFTLTTGTRKTGKRLRLISFHLLEFHFRNEILVLKVQLILQKIDKHHKNCQTLDSYRNLRRLFIFYATIVPTSPEGDLNHAIKNPIQKTLRSSRKTRTTESPRT